MDPVLAVKIMGAYGRVLENAPSRIVLPESMLPCEKELIKEAIKFALTQMEADHAKRENLKTAYSCLATFIPDIEAGLGFKAQTAMESGEIPKLRIPVKTAAHTGGNRPPVPENPPKAAGFPSESVAAFARNMHRNHPEELKDIERGWEIQKKALAEQGALMEEAKSFVPGNAQGVFTAMEQTNIVHKASLVGLVMLILPVIIWWPAKVIKVYFFSLLFGLILFTDVLRSIEATEEKRRDWWRDIPKLFPGALAASVGLSVIVTSAWVVWKLAPFLLKEGGIVALVIVIALWCGVFSISRNLLP